MANQEHLDILKQGVEAWNAWRRDNSAIVPDLKGADLSQADLSRADLSGADLSGAILVQANLSTANLVRANLRGAALVGASIFQARLSGASLIKASLIGANLSGADLSRADLSGADLIEANLLRAEVRGADLSGTLLVGAIFHTSPFEGTLLSGATLMDTVFAGVNLAGARGLDRCEHQGPSHVDTLTLEISGPLPESFLRGCGLSDRLIEYLPALTKQPIQLYSCFISFTEADDEFAARLYIDLQGKGVRCWRWKEDARGGRSLIGEVNRAVRLYDKLIVVCSENSLKSGPVIREIERALQREDQLTSQRKRAEVLFPLRLDDAIFDWEHPRKADVVGKVVSDFRNWKDHDKYQKAFERLLRDLKLDE